MKCKRPTVDHGVAMTVESSSGTMKNIYARVVLSDSGQESEKEE